MQSTGNHCIGTTTPNKKLDVEDDIQIGTGTTGCVLDADNTTLVGTCVSDIRLKENIRQLPPQLDKISALRPVSFSWKNNTAVEYGLIAQDVRKVMPELVQQDDKGYLRVSYDTHLSMAMLQAVRELKAENDALKKEKDMEISSLKRENDGLKADISALKEEVGKLKISINGGK